MRVSVNHFVLLNQHDWKYDGVVGWRCVQGKSLYLELDEENVTLIDPQDLSVLNVQPIQSIRVWGVGRNNGRLASIFF